MSLFVTFMSLLCHFMLFSVTFMSFYANFFSLFVTFISSSSLSNTLFPVLFQEHTDLIVVLDYRQGLMALLKLPLKVHKLFIVNARTWVLQESDRSEQFVLRTNEDHVTPAVQNTWCV